MLPPSFVTATRWSLRIPVDGHERLCNDALGGMVIAIWSLGLSVGLYPPKTGTEESICCWVEQRKGWMLFCAEVELLPRVPR